MVKIFNSNIFTVCAEMCFCSFWFLFSCLQCWCSWSSEWQRCFPQSTLQVSSPLNYLLVPEPCWAWGLFLPPSHSATVQHSRPNCWADRQLKKRKQNHYSGNFCSSEINSAEPPKVWRLHSKENWWKTIIPETQPTKKMSPDFQSRNDDF